MPNVWLPFASGPLSGMLNAVEPFCSASLKPTKPLTVPVKLTGLGLGAHVVQSDEELLQPTNDAAMRHEARARGKVIFSLPLNRADAAQSNMNTFAPNSRFCARNAPDCHDEHHENGRASIQYRQLVGTGWGQSRLHGKQPPCPPPFRSTN